jgi:hypothetical protein
MVSLFFGSWPFWDFSRTKSALFVGDLSKSLVQNDGLIETAFLPGL